MTAETRLNSRGQITLPKPLRDALSLKPGDQVNCTLMPDGTILLRAKNKSLVDLAGRLHRRGRKPLPIEALSL